MKKIVIALIINCLTSTIDFSQQNTFPNNGNVGIGTIVPQFKLDVNGALKVETSTWLKGEVKMTNLQDVSEGPVLGGGNGQGLGIGQGGINQSLNQYKFLVVGEDGIIRRLAGIGPPVGDGDTDDNPCNLPNKEKWENGLDKLFVRCPSVNVGINTTAPRVKLDVLGTSYSENMVIGNINPTTIGNSLLYMKAPANFNGVDRIFSLNSASSELLNISNEGRFTLRTSLPPNDASKIFTVNNTTNELFSINNVGSVRTKEIDAHGRVHIHTDISRNNPNVIDIFGIWSTTGKLLQVNSDGLLLVREIKLNQTWADYVFDKKYPLMPLEEVEKFIAVNKHLPKVPSAEVIETEGIGLSETNKIFIEKIEELTLYLIEQNKELSLLKEQVKLQQKEIELLKK